MTTVTAGTESVVPVAIDSTVTITPPTPGSVAFRCIDRYNIANVAARQITSAQTITIPAGSTMFIRANNGDATFSVATSALLLADGSVLALTEATPYVNLTATGTAFSGACELAGYDCTTAAGNITIYDGTDTSGTVIVAATALSLGRVEFAYKRSLTTGCHVVLSGAATVNILVG